MIGPPEDLQARLQGYLEEQIGAPTAITRLERMAGGASRESWRVDLSIQSGAKAGDYALVLRRDLRSELQPDALDRAAEFRLLQLAYEADVLVPRPRWMSSDASVLGYPFLLMDRIEGESIGPRVIRRPELASAREALPGQMALQLAKIHQIGIAGSGDQQATPLAETQELAFLPRPDAQESPAAHSLRRLRSHAKAIGIENPAYEFALRWLEARAPETAQLSLVHGDFRVGNVIINEQGLLAIIDWEFAHLGDPHEDLAWPTVRDWRFGQVELTFGGVGKREDFFAAYELAAGRPVDPKAVGYWEILGNLRWAIGCLSQAHRHLHAGDTSVELASLGRRAAEMELEFLRLIEAAG